MGRARAQDVILVGPRGVGKTVTLTTYGAMAAVAGFEVVNLQAVAGQSGLVESLLQRSAGRIAEQAGPWTRAKRAAEPTTCSHISTTPDFERVPQARQLRRPAACSTSEASDRNFTVICDKPHNADSARPS